MPKIIRLRKSTPSASIDLEKIFYFFNEKSSPEGLIIGHERPLFWLEKINKSLENHPRLLLESSIESILMSLTAEESRTPIFNINQLLNEILKLSKTALASPKITITSTGVMLNHLNFEGINDWVAPTNSDETKTPKRNSFWVSALKLRWNALKESIKRDEQHINQRKPEIVRYFNLPPEQHERYKTESYNRQKETIKQLEIKIKPVRDEMTRIVEICDATLNKAHHFIEPLIFAKNMSVDAILIPDSLTQLLFKQYRTQAETYLKEILAEEQEQGFAYMDRYRKNEVLGGIYLLLGEHEKALPYLSNAAKFVMCTHALFCEQLVRTLTSKPSAVDESSAASAALSR